MVENGGEALSVSGTVVFLSVNRVRDNPPLFIAPYYVIQFFNYCTKHNSITDLNILRLCLF